jgi:hypothetical protein
MQHVTDWKQLTHPGPVTKRSFSGKTCKVLAANVQQAVTGIRHMRTGLLSLNYITYLTFSHFNRHYSF